MTAVRVQPPHYVAVDVETTGLYTADRVVEVAAVTVSADGRVIDEWDTLVNPGRDVGPTSLHGITASMVSPAPGFEEVAMALASRLPALRVVIMVPGAPRGLPTRRRPH